MMGRQKGETGKKGRPSSSSLAASLLPSGASTIGFGGYVGSSRLLPGEDSVAVSGVDGDMAQHLKRLGRKDPTTKVKALMSLSALFKEKSGEEVALVIPQWAFEYKRLLFDYNREVRRASNETMTCLVSTVRRGLAPHLKFLMGPWWFSQFDPVPEVSQAARQSLQAAFPTAEKRLDALILCANEIFLYLDENLKLTPQAMSDKAVPMDELEDMHQRVISSSLLALATIVDILLGIESTTDSDNVTAESSKHASKARFAAISSAEKIFLSHKYFLQMFKSQIPGIRSSTYSVLACFIKHMPHLFNEGNLKTLSASILGAFQEKSPTCHSSMWHMILLFSKRFPESWSLTNVQKNVLSRLWHFLRNGCYGSQQISYQNLVPFLETVPPQAVAGEQFLLNFFQNFWTGRKPLYSSDDLPVFFKALKECFLWAVCNASRYMEGMDAFTKLQVALIDQIVLKVLWHEYLYLSSPKDHGTFQSSEPEISSQSDAHEKPIELRNIKYSRSYIQELGTCIIEIVSDIHLKEPNLIGAFCGPVLKYCLEIFESREASQHVEQIMQFFILLKQHVVDKGEMWPLVALAGPLVASSFQLIKSVDSPDGIRLLSAICTVFGPRTVIPKFVLENKLQLDAHFANEDADRLMLDNFMQIFTNDLVPWCLDRTNGSISSRLDLLLALLDEELFHKQWSTIVTYATKLEGYDGSCLHLDCVAVLAMLMEKVRGRTGKNKMSAELWNHELLDKAAISIICQHCSFDTTHTRFLWAVLGGTQEDGQDCFLSGPALTFVLAEITKKLALFLAESCLSWTKQTSSLIQCSETKDLKQYSTFTLAQIVENAYFALEILDGSFFCLKILDGNSDLVPSILAAVLIIAQEGRFLSLIEDTSILDLVGNDVLKLQLRKLVHAFLGKINSKFCKSLSSHSLKKLQGILVQAVRCALFDRDAYGASKIPDFCSKWALAVLELTCRDHLEEQIVLDHLLSDAEYWSLWVVLDVGGRRRSTSLKVESTHSDVQEFNHHQFTAFVDKLISSLGAERVICGSISHASSEEAQIFPVSPLASYSRAWLAAELLCTWKWQGGSALGSLLPFLSMHAKNMNSSYEESLICSVIDILLEGMIVHGASFQLKFFNAWSAMDDEVENLQDPFLRGLVSLFSVLMIKDSIWEKGDIFSLFSRLLQHFFIGTTIHRSRLRILPFVLNVIMRPLLSKSSCEDGPSNIAGFDSSKEEQLHNTISNWLDSALSLPPLTLPQTEQGKTGEWIQLVISCFPLNPTGGLATLELAFSRDIRQSEKKLLLDLFRKNSCPTKASADSSNMEKPLSESGKMILANLMAVSLAYCWQNFCEEDLEFLLGNIRSWIQAAVVPIEEVAEMIAESITKSSTSVNLEVSEKETEEAVKCLDHSLMDFSRIPLFILSLICGITEFRQAQGSEISHWFKTEKQAHVKDQILEDVLRLFFATGISEAIASAYGRDGSSIIASARLKDSHFWDLVAFNVINSPDHVRRTAMESVELWGLSKGAISALYAILFSSKPIASLQVAAYIILSTGPIDHIAVRKEDTRDDRFDQSMLSSEEPFRFRDEISYLIEKAPSELYAVDLAEQTRVNVFLAWALLLTHLQSLSSSSSSSSTRERLVQRVQESASSSILDCIFQHIPLKSGPNISKKKEVELLPETSRAAASAKRAITTCSLLFAVECLCPVGSQEMASLAGAIYGLMLRLLPSYVRSWFAGLRDRATSSAIESFTKMWCSPPLLADELSQIKGAALRDENFSVCVSKSAYEVIATYKKEESGMDLVIQLPSCYPLRPVDVDCTRSLGISEVKQRKWLLSLAAFVRNQNGALAEAIRIWKSNFDKEFEGVEECPICYSIIHTSNHSLPQLACKTCKHKFHSACLYKWFSTSHKSTCPLCQTPF
ncbi:E3 ubiquitin-protein ligase listerin [Aristolochia californica]|uniref:E3 ubiquitin-protein ligase listerin n=1 Tax=Aristolochia californica TaxID=171875 RepID=UPI0035DA1A95